MNKFFYYILNFSFISLILLYSISVCAADFELKSGFYVTNCSLGIHGKTELVIFSDLYLDNASVIGTGTLTLQTSKETKVISENSTINNFKINGKNQVKLKGDLQIISSLIINQATLDATKARLLFGKNIALTLLNGAKILQTQSYFWTVTHNSNLTNNHSNYFVDFKFIDPPFFGLSSRLTVFRNTLAIISAVLNPHLPPPKYAVIVSSKNNFLARNY